MQAMVERPPITPPAASVVAARGVQFARVRQQRRGALALLVVLGVGVAAFNATRADDRRGISVASEGTAAAGYIAEAPGGYVAEGAWRLTITRGREVIELSSTSSPDCGSTGIILPGDHVRGSITGSMSRLSVGERLTCPG
jgi:hypothetical protein